MSNLPTPPAPAPEPNRIDNVSPTGDGRSSYWGLDAQETVATYVKRVRAIKAQSIALILANLVAMIWFVEEGHFALYLVCFVFLLAIELAHCDYLELDSVGALRRLESVTFKRKDNVRWFRAMQIEFLSRIDVGDLEGARDALSKLSAFRKNFKEGSRNRASADLQVADYAVLVRPPAERDAADAARMRERMALADCHQQRANWQLYLAEYELLHGLPEEAARLVGDPTLEPLTPRMERLRAEVLSGMEVSG